MTSPASLLRTLRLERGWTLRQLAHQMQTSVACLSDLERGKGAHAELLVRLAQLYHVPPYVLSQTLPPGLAELVAHPDTNFSPAWIQTLCRLEFRHGQELSAQAWWSLSETLRQSLP
ncbi:helix-turn-helix transcriptional regulator (plasmid) [Deinococcus sp. KNUC1210]|uniref:helix-turn-helix domain-containing protein n=1 Tax=Deinococcus sp. KNUC1210 TaxID=2917691 RepID=UPI001EEF8F8F|nr:helix-turn-helix transcriptional regulator [Deinococcus sp. KNUC1210]ULH17962.1 helix-turn-helix transcriptional regulator [Deinococcus sp. KNUC1210]